MNKTFTSQPLCIGFFVNPFAGAGGPAGHKGSDLAQTREALIRGELTARAPERAQQFLQALSANSACRFITPRGVMGEDLLAAHSPYPFTCLPRDIPDTCSAQDTRLIVEDMLAHQVDMIVFVGGDGTARDVCVANTETTPVLGVPSGVKMHSGVFAITPTAAAVVLNAVLAGELVSLSEQEVRDIDEQALQTGRVASRYFGSQWVPHELQYIQSVKSGGAEVDELVLADIAAEIEERLREQENHDALVVFATGSTAQFIQQELGCEGTLLGVDVMRSGELIAQDVSAKELEALLTTHEGKVVLIVTAIGGQGHVFGRGNQQLSPAVLRRIGRENVWLVMTKTKLQGLHGRPLLMDSNDPDLDNAWQGLIPVITGYRDHALYRLGALVYE